MLDFLEKLVIEVNSTGEYDINNRVFELLNDKNTNPTRMIVIGSELYRARKIEGSEPINISKSFYGYDSRGSFVNPNTHSIKAMRANKAEQPRLYCANVSYLPLVEVKPSVGEEISLARIKTNELLKLLDLTLYHLTFDMPEEKQELFRELSRLFSLPIDDDKDDESEYRITQEIADYVEKLGYDGIAYSSALLPDLNKENYNGANFVIFNYKHCVPIKSNVLKMTSKENQEKYNYDYSNFCQIDKDKEKLVLITSENRKYNFHFTFGSNPDPKVFNPTHINPNVFVSVGNLMFNTPVRMVSIGKTGIASVGKMLQITLEGNIHKKTQYTFPDNLNDRINDLTLILKCIEEGKIWFGDAAGPQRGSFDINLPLEQYAGHIDWYKKQLTISSEIKQALLSINQYFDIDMQNANNVDKLNTEIIVNCLLKNGELNTNLKFNRFQPIDIQGNKVYLIFDKTGENKYKVSNFFGNVVEIECLLDDIPIKTSQFSMLTPETLVLAKNIDFDVLVSSYEKLYDEKTNYHLPHRANEDLWNLIKAYDISKDSKFLNCADRINEWIKGVDYSYVNETHLSFINHCQIYKRKGVLSKEDIKQLKWILLQKEKDNRIVPMIHILLDNNKKAKKEYDKLSNEHKEWFLNLPIANLLPQLIDRRYPV